MTGSVVIARRRATLINILITDDSSEARWTQTGVLSHAVNTGTVISTRSRSTVVNVHFTPFTCNTLIRIESLYSLLNITFYCFIVRLCACLFHVFSAAPSGLGLFLSPDLQFGTHCLMICVIQLWTSYNFGGTWRRTCSSDIWSVSALGVLT